MRTDTFFANYLNKLEWIWYVKLKRKFKLIWAVFVTILSVLMVISEALIFFKTFNLSIFGIILNWLLSFDLTYSGIQMVTLIPLMYMSYNVFYGLFRLKISGFYGLYPKNHTDSPSLLFATVNFSRVTAPLCFNFFNMLRYSKEI